MGAKIRPCIVSMSLLILAIQAVHSLEGDTEMVWPAVLEITQASTHEANLLFQKVIEDAVTLELERTGLRVISFRRLAAGEKLASEVKTDLSDLARKAAADFVLMSSYAIEGNTIRIDFTWYDTAEDLVTATASKISRMDLTLDRVIKEAVTEILESQKERISTLVKEVEKKESEEAEQSREEQALKDRITPREEGAEPLLKRFEVSVGLSPFIATGDVSAYFKFGLMPILYGGYRIPLPSGFITVGLFAGISIFQAEGFIASSENLLIPVGPDLRYTLGRGGPIELYASLAAGPAVFMVTVEGTDRYVKIIPFATAGIGFSLPFNETFGFTVDASYAVFFDKESLLMGFTPAGCLYMRF
jgi:hypothetical protein